MVIPLIPFSVDDYLHNIERDAFTSLSTIVILSYQGCGMSGMIIILWCMREFPAMLRKLDSAPGYVNIEFLYISFPSFFFFVNSSNNFV